MAENKVCKQCNTQFIVEDDDLEFYDKISPVFDGKKFSIPAPTLCPDCRAQRRQAHINQIFLFKRKCDLCNKEMVTIYSPDKNFNVYCQECWWSDKWDPRNYQIEYNSSVPFFDQFKNLINQVPRLGIVNRMSQNSDYCNYSLQNKNCYLTFGSHREENCMYGQYSTKNNECLDCYWIYNCELCYECIYSTNCYKSIFLDHSQDCSNCYFSDNLTNCKHCAFCSNLNNKEYYFENKKLTEKEYFEKLETFRINTFEGLEKSKKHYSELMTKFLVRFAHLINCDNCTGDNQKKSKDLVKCFNCSDCENVSYSNQIDASRHSMDMTCMGYDPSEFCYQTIGCTDIHGSIGCDSCWNSSNMYYSNLCFSSKDCVGCIGLRHSQYSILNKKYSKEEYNKIASQIADNLTQNNEWGNFLPISISPFGYNETIAKNYFSLSKNEAISLGIKWQDDDFNAKIEHNSYNISEDINYYSNNDKINELLSSTIKCSISEKYFKILPLELDLYLKLNIPIPRIYPDERFKNRLKRIRQNKLYHRQCMCNEFNHDHTGQCSNEFETTYAPDRPEKVFCEECYQKTVV